MRGVTDVIYSKGPQMVTMPLSLVIDEVQLKAKLLNLFEPLSNKQYLNTF